MATTSISKSSTSKEEQATLLDNASCTRPTELSLNRFEDEINKSSSDMLVYRETTFKDGLSNSKLSVPESVTSNIKEVPVASSLSLNSSHSKKKQPSFGAIPQYATTVTNVTFAYGRGKKAVNALNDITIKVPVGSM